MFLTSLFETKGQFSKTLKPFGIFNILLYCVTMYDGMDVFFWSKLSLIGRLSLNSWKNCKKMTGFVKIWILGPFFHENRCGNWNLRKIPLFVNEIPEWPSILIFYCLSTLFIVPWSYSVSNFKTNAQLFPELRSFENFNVSE